MFTNGQEDNHSYIYNKIIIFKPLCNKTHWVPLMKGEVIFTECGLDTAIFRRVLAVLQPSHGHFHWYVKPDNYKAIQNKALILQHNHLNQQAMWMTKTGMF